jgi:phage shock protein A
MGVLGRLFKMGKAKANEALDDIEKPIELYNQKLRDMREKLRQAEISSASVIGNASGLEKKVQDSEQEVKDWDENIMKAVAAGNNELAKKGIERKADLEQNLVSLKKAADTARTQAETIKKTIKNLKEEIDSTERNRDAFAARYNTAEASQKVNEIMADVSTKKNDINLSDLEEKLEKKEALANGLGEIADLDHNNLEDEFAKLNDVNVDSELAKYQARLDKKE